MPSEIVHNAAADELQKFGDLAADWWDEDGPLGTLHAINPLRTEFIANRAHLAGARVLDVGCGAGLLAESLARRGAEVTGIDLALPSIGVAAAHAADQGLDIEYLEGSAEQIADERPGQFDVVTCLELLEHVPRPDSVVAACARAVKPDGIVFFSTINRTLRSFIGAILGAEYVLRIVPRGTHEYRKLLRPSELAQAARSSGLDVTELTGLHFNPVTRGYRLGGHVGVNYFAVAIPRDRL